LTNGIYTPYTGLTDERYTWRCELQNGIWYEPYVLQQYRANRDSNLWRATREVEKLCEYILHLEGAKPMSETYKVTCDHCDTDITADKYYPTYRIRLQEEVRNLLPEGEQGEAKPELSRAMNFCNLEHLQDWLLRGNDEPDQPSDEPTDSDKPSDE